MASNSPIPTVEQGFFIWARKNPSALSDAIVTLNKLCSLEVAFGGQRFPVKFAGENALIDLKQTIVSSISNLPAMAAYTVLGNPEGSLKVPVATSTPILTSVTFGASGGSITGTAGAVQIAAAGTNQNVTITPSGQGSFDVVTSSVTDAATARFRNTTATSSCNVRLFNDQNNAGRTLDLTYTGSSYGASPYAGGIAGESGSLSTSSAFPIQFATNNTYRGAVLSSGRWLFGTSSDDGANLVQIGGNAKVNGILTTVSASLTGALTINNTAAGGILLNTSSGQPYILIQISTTSYGVIGVNNAADDIITGTPAKELCFRSVTQGISMSGNNGASIGIKITTSNNVEFPSGSIKTAAPSGGTAQAWKLGTVASVSPTAQNRTIEVEVNGTTYYLTAKTTND